MDQWGHYSFFASCVSLCTSSLVRVGTVSKEVEHRRRGREHRGQGIGRLQELGQAVRQEQEASPNDVLIAVRTRQVDAHLAIEKGGGGQGHSKGEIYIRKKKCQYNKR